MSSTYDALIREVCDDTPPVPFDILKAMVSVESNFNPKARSKSDARGLCQLIPKWHATGVGAQVAKALGKPLTDDLWYDPEFSLRAGALHLRWCYTSDGSKSWERAVRKYHSGSADPPADFVDGQGTSSDAHIKKFRDALASLHEGTDMAYTPKQLYMWLHEGRTMGERYYAGVHHYIPNRGGSSVEGIVHHIQEGYNTGSWQHFHVVDASATVFIGKNGDIWWLVDEKHGPWTNGDVKAPDAFIRAMINKYGPDPNRWTLTIEYEGFTGNLPYTEEQYQSGLWLTRLWMKKYGITDIQRATIRHGQINSVDRYYCCEKPGGPFLTRMRKDLAAGTAPDVSAPFKTGDTVEFTENLNVRRAWTTAATFQGKPNVLATKPAGTKATIIAGPNYADGYTWWDISIDGFGTGHVAGDWLKKVEAPQPAPKPLHKTFTVRFEVPIRKAPGFTGEIIKNLPAGTKGVVISGPKDVDGVGWYDLRIEGLGTGWVQDAILNTLTIEDAA